MGSWTAGTVLRARPWLLADHAEQLHFQYLQSILQYRPETVWSDLFRLSRIAAVHGVRWIHRNVGLSRLTQRYSGKP